MKPFFLFAFIAGVLLMIPKQANNLPRGIRNNNPGNIRKSATVWQGMSADQTDPDFIRFTSPVYGIRAMARVLKTYRTKYQLYSVEDIIDRWAPPVENNTKSYIWSVASKLNVSPFAPLDDSEDQMVDLIGALIHHENGMQPYSVETIKEGIRLA